MMLLMQNSQTHNSCTSGQRLSCGIQTELQTLLVCYLTRIVSHCFCKFLCVCDRGEISCFNKRKFDNDDYDKENGVFSVGRKVLLHFIRKINDIQSLWELFICWSD